MIVIYYCAGSRVRSIPGTTRWCHPKSSHRKSAESDWWRAVLRTTARRIRVAAGGAIGNGCSISSVQPWWVGRWACVSLLECACSVMQCGLSCSRVAAVQRGALGVDVHCLVCVCGGRRRGKVWLWRCSRTLPCQGSSRQLQPRSARRFPFSWLIPFARSVRCSHVASHVGCCVRLWFFVE